jgi:hypothetical protein
MYVDFGNIGLGGRLVTAPPKAFTDSWRLISLTRQPGGLTTIHINGAPTATGILKAAFAPDSSGNLVLGDFDFHGDIAEIIGFKEGLTNEQRSGIEAHLARKYTLTFKGTFFHTDFKISSNGESISLYSPEGALIDQTPTVPIPTDVSLDRINEVPDNWQFFPSPTPHQINDETGLKGPPNPPLFSHDAGFYEESFPLEMTHTDPMTTIRFTTDGSEPMVTVSDANLLLSYHLTRKALESNFFWEHSSDLKN